MDVNGQLLLLCFLPEDSHGKHKLVQYVTKALLL